MYKGKIFKESIHSVNPYHPDTPLGSDESIVYHAIASVYLKEGKVFEGKISDHIALAAEVDLSEQNVRGGFQGLVDSGYLTFGDDGDTFTPTEKLIRLFS